MNRQRFYPIDLSEQALWLGNFRDRLPEHCERLGIAAELYQPVVRDAAYLAFLIGRWIGPVRRFPVACTSYLENMQMGSGPAQRPQWTEPAIPEGVVEVEAGALRRIFKFVQFLKNTRGYDDRMGALLRLLPRADAAERPVPVFSLSIDRGPTGERVKVRFFKYGHAGVVVESRRGAADASWEQVDVAIRSPWFDKRPLLVPGQPEIREYRMCFWDGGPSPGDWADVSQVTVSP